MLGHNLADRNHFFLKRKPVYFRYKRNPHMVHCLPLCIIIAATLTIIFDKSSILRYTRLASEDFT